VEISASDLDVFRRHPAFIAELLRLDSVLAEFELAYVSTVVQVRSMRQVDRLQEVLCLFSDATHDALKKGLFSMQMVEECDPSLMFTIPRLAILRGILASIQQQSPSCPQSSVSLSNPRSKFKEDKSWGPVDPDNRNALADIFLPFHVLLTRLK
jgi:hypothetical protein